MSIYVYNNRIKKSRRERCTGMIILKSMRIFYFLLHPQATWSFKENHSSLKFVKFFFSKVPERYMKVTCDCCVAVMLLNGLLFLKQQLQDIVVCSMKINICGANVRATKFYVAQHKLHVTRHKSHITVNVVRHKSHISNMTLNVLCCLGRDAVAQLLTSLSRKRKDTILQNEFLSKPQRYSIRLWRMVDFVGVSRLNFSFLFIL